MPRRLPDKLQRYASLLFGSAVLGVPAVAEASEFDAMADFFAWVGLVLLFVIFLLVVGLVCGLASRRKSPSRPWKRPTAIGSLIALALAVVGVFVITLLSGSQHGPMDEAIILASITSAPSIPSILFAWRLLKRSSRAPEAA